MRKYLSVVLLFTLVLALAACVAPAATTTTEAPAAEAPAEAAASTDGAVDPSSLTFRTVVKIAGINWFNRLEEGVVKFGEDTGVNSLMLGPAEADAAQQIPIIEDLIAQNVDALCVVPMSPEQLDPVLARAMEAGIKVVTHEAASQQSMDFDIEAFDNTAYGAGLMDQLAERMGGEGEYAVFVGSLGSETHNQWVDGAIARQLEAYPNMTLVGDKNETFDDSTIAYEKTKELLRTYPNLKGFQGSASTDVPGIGLAIEEAGLNDETVVVGTSLPSIAGDLMQTGAIDVIGFWDPARAGEACNVVALKLIQGEEVGEGTDLGVEGYNSLTQVDRVLFGNAAVYLTVDGLADYDF